MLHIDDTSCNNSRKTLPSRSKIAHYWKDKSLEYFDYLMDWGEPSCWACNMFIGSLDTDLRDVNTLADIFKVWISHNYLQRCHIVPKALRGCNCEANLILLCRKCHKASPDTRDPIHFVKWVKNRKKFALTEIKDAFDSFEYIPEEGDAELFISNEFRQYVLKNTVLVAGSLPLSSFLATFIEFKIELKLLERPIPNTLIK